ncbi:MerR family transcriptional regulator [Arhodomonas sp. AD133]|uniref:MerR family transcriptional regulator n=1 Tax=Arhodomonas sp. AD133 TaxID=3415009 RepID=UPI003EBBC1BF
MRIGELAAETGVKIETIRYYERVEILPAPARTANNYRTYTRTHLRRLRFVRRARALGFTLDEVRTLLAMIDGGDYTCAEVKTLGERHLADIRAKIAELRRMEDVMGQVVEQCSGARTPDCSMLEALFDGDDRGVDDLRCRRPGV